MSKLLSILLLALLPAYALATPANDLVSAARSQIGVTLHYNPAYEKLAYPGGDVPMERGVCTDVVVRAYRKLGLDLQKLVHEDMKKAWSAYPHAHKWQLKKPDPNIDHRRVPNLATFLARHGTTIAPGKVTSAYLPGDVITWRLPGNLTHIGIVGDTRTASGTPLVIHNIGAGAQEEDMLFKFDMTGHYRWNPQLRLGTPRSGQSGAMTSTGR
jgi:uncharacterized protein YijF (DUF1287 family)